MKEARSRLAVLRVIAVAGIAVSVSIRAAGAPAPAAAAAGEPFAAARLDDLRQQRLDERSAPARGIQSS